MGSFIKIKEGMGSKNSELTILRRMESQAIFARAFRAAHQ
jgi:hypothetical protein